MLSGALIFGKEEGYKFIFKHRILKFIIVLTIWTLIYEPFILNKILNLGNIENALKSMIKIPVSLQFWYLHMLIRLYIMNPFIKKDDNTI